MTAIHVAVRPRAGHTPSGTLSPLHGLFDVVVDGVNITARIGDGLALTLLADLGSAVGNLCLGQRNRQVLHLYTDQEVWELGLERDGDQVLTTVYRSGPCTEVAVFERRVTLEALRSGLLAAIDETLASAHERASASSALQATRRRLVEAWPATRKPRLSRQTVRIQAPPQVTLGLCATAAFRLAREVDHRGSNDPQVEQADVHSLLLEGQVSVLVRGRETTLGQCQLFLLAEHLVALADETLDSWRDTRALLRRVRVGAAYLGVRRPPGDGPLELRVTGVRERQQGGDLVFPALSATELGTAVVDFVQELTRTFSITDPRQERNLRLRALQMAAESLRERLADTACDDALTNPDPDAYRGQNPKLSTQTPAPGLWAHGGKMRFLPTWLATVPNIDVESTFVCGEHVIVGAARETACLDRSSGGVLWRCPTERGGSVPTPEGLVRVSPDGRLSLHDLATGERRFTQRLAPRAAGGATGAVVCTPGLPKLVVVAEGDRHITAVDLVSGEVRWRHTARRPAAHRVRRAGKLLLVTGADSALVALSATSGEIVWRVRDRLPFSSLLSVDDDAVFVMSGSPSGAWRLHHVDLWTGELRYSVPIEGSPAPRQSPLLTRDAVVVPTREANGTGAKGFDRASGACLWQHDGELSSATSAWLALEDAVIANADNGVLLCLEARAGRVRFNHVFSRHVDADGPRRLTPMLRSGALFVPQHQVHVVRPSDGDLLGTVPSDLIADLVRVDERCGVYIAEESGHLAAFSVAPRLALVR